MKLFLSYRRDDSAFASQAIHERLSRRFGPQSVFIDVDSIPAGVDFREHISRSIASCRLVVAIIGPTWLATDEEGQMRLHNPGDFVRIEIESALREGLAVLPVLVGQAAMPSEDVLPEGLKPLAYRQALRVRPGRDFQQDIDQVMRAVARLVADKPPTIPARPGEILTTDTGVREVVLPAGVLLVQPVDAQREEAGDDIPRRQVRITEPLSMSITPVTQSQFEMLMEFNPSKYVGDAKRPVDTVSLGDAAAFCNALSQAEGRLPYYEIRGQNVSVAGGAGYRLPRESEWEYACRAGTSTSWSFGAEDEVDRYAWYLENAEDSTHAAGTKLPNPWGLYDMHGNVWELCWDLLLTRNEEICRTMPVVISPPSECILRGGCFVDPPWALQSGYRSSIRVAVRSNRVGFRVVRSYRSQDPQPAR